MILYHYRPFESALLNLKKVLSIFLRQHRTENCVQKMSPSDKIQSWINK